MIRLRYGDARELRIELPAEATVADYSEPRGCPLTNPATAVAAALSEPWDYPPLSQAVTPGDRVVLAIDRGVPQLAEVVAGVVQTLVIGSVSPEDITVLLAPRNGVCQTSTATASLPPDLARSIRVLVHDPQDHAELSYLAASKRNLPIFIQRQLVDADLILPIGCLRPRRSPGAWGVYGGLLPAFSDVKTRGRFLSAASSRVRIQRRRRRDEVAEAAWLLGIQVVLQLIPGLGGTILHVLAGNPESVAKRGRPLGDAAWLCRAPHRPELVIAAIEGGDDQNWEDFARALSAAMSAVADGGAILLCTDLHCLPGPALQALSAWNDDGAAAREIRRARSPDAVSAALLADALQRAQVYLLSGLDQETVEDLGVGYVSDAEEVNHLCRQFASFLVLADAHRTGIVIGDD